MSDPIKTLEDRLKAAEQELIKQSNLSDSKNRYIKRGWQVTIRELSKTNAKLEKAEKKLIEQNQQLQELNLIKDQFIGIASHDLRNPLHVLNGYLKILRYALSDREMPDEEAIAMIESMEQTIGYMSGLVNNFLDHNMISSGSFPLSKSKADLYKLQNEVISSNRPLAAKKGVELVCKFQAELDEFYFDCERIKQVLENLISNSIKFSESGTCTTVESTLSDQHVLICIADEGIGIHQEELANIFEPFQKGSLSATNNEKGSGLGLSIVKKIVEAHEGTIEVTSVLGEGSTFQIQLPYER